MNWLDSYLQNNEEGYFLSSDGSYWVLWGEDEYRLALGDGESSDLVEISRDEFICKTID